VKIPTIAYKWRNNQIT